MKHQKRILILFVLTLFSFSSLNAQKIKHKFGKLNSGEAEMKFYAPDSSASAVILFDKGYSYFEYDNQIKDFIIIFQRTLRIKIFKKDAYSYADFEIPLYIGNNGREELVTSLKGRTFNFENGKVIVTKVSKANIFYDNKSKHEKVAKVSFPNVKEGSIIDIDYKVSSDFIFNLRGWQFQYKIPVLYSEYSTLVPEYFKYNINQKGYESVFLNEKKEYRTEEFSVEYRTGPGQMGRIEKGTIIYTSNSGLTTWSASKIPAFVTEPYITTAKNYMSSLNFELKSISYPDRPVINITTSWKDVDKKLINNPYLGKQLKVTSLIKSKADNICNELKTKDEKIRAIYNWVKKNIKWNGYNSKFITKKLNSVIDNKKGNSADVNMLLITMLKSQGVNVNPIILSTRNHGMIFPAHPTLSTFNYIIAEVKTDDKTIYLDATDENLSFGMLPFRCLNGKGRRIGTVDAGEINIVPPAKYQESYMYNLTVKPNEGTTGKVTATFKGYAAYDLRNDIDDTGGEEEYITKEIDNNKNAEISDISFKNINDLTKPLSETYNFASSDYVTFAGNMIYITALSGKEIAENPFKLDDRKYPVDFGYPVIKKVIIQYTLPEGYKLSEKPENVAFALPGRAAQFQYQISSVGNIVQVISIFRINKPVFQYDSYKSLKNFYDLVIKKQNEKIVLTKI